MSALSVYLPLRQGQHGLSAQAKPRSPQELPPSSTASPPSVPPSPGVLLLPWGPRRFSALSPKPLFLTSELQPICPRQNCTFSHTLTLRGIPASNLRQQLGALCRLLTLTFIAYLTCCSLDFSFYFFFYSFSVIFLFSSCLGAVGAQEPAGLWGQTLRGCSRRVQPGLPSPQGKNGAGEQAKMSASTEVWGETWSARPQGKRWGSYPQISSRLLLKKPPEHLHNLHVVLSVLNFWWKICTYINF